MQWNLECQAIPLGWGCGTNGAWPSERAELRVNYYYQKWDKQTRSILCPRADAATTPCPTFLFSWGSLHYEEEGPKLSSDPCRTDENCTEESWRWGDPTMIPMWTSWCNNFDRERDADLLPKWSASKLSVALLENHWDVCPEYRMLEPIQFRHLKICMQGSRHQTPFMWGNCMLGVDHEYANNNKGRESLFNKSLLFVINQVIALAAPVTSSFAHSYTFVQSRPVLSPSYLCN